MGSFLSISFLHTPLKHQKRILPSALDSVGGKGEGLVYSLADFVQQ